MKHWKRSVRIASGMVLLLAGIWLFLPRPEIYPSNAGFSQVVLDRSGQVLRITLSQDDKYRIFTPLAHISEELQGATLLHEDRKFYQHSGVDASAIVRSAWNMVTGGPRTGGSTITMQLARLRFGMRSRSIPGKVAQMFRAVQLERHYSKEEIFEAYLNLAPYGGNLEGIGAASRIYLDKAPSELTRREAIALSVIPQSPARRTPARDGSRNPHLAEAQARLFARFRDQEGLAADPLDAQFTISQPATRPFEGPHLTRRLLRQFPLVPEIRSTIDRDQQAVLEASMSAYLRRHHGIGLRNASALLVDTTSMEVRAYLGSGDFWNVPIQGQVDGIRMRRSPGSSLKPFIYALGLEQGIIHPNTLLKDAKASFGAYSPENFDRGYSGPLSATEALQRSRNVPAVALMATLKRPSFYAFLQRGGIDLPHPASHYGLSLALGGAEVSLEELVRLYTILPNDGNLRQLVYSDEDPGPIVSHQILSPEAAFLTLSMIRDIPAPGMSRRHGISRDRPVYWKTGTSHGFRDAWAVAVFDRYVLGLWIGDFRGAGNASFVAREATAPLLFDMIGSLRAHQPDESGYVAQPTGLNLRRINLCAVSGQMPNTHCPTSREGWFIPGRSPIDTCAIHRQVAIDAETGLRLRPEENDGTREVSRKVYEFWPSDLLQLYREAGIAMNQPPPFRHGAGSAEASAGTPLRIVSPEPDTIYTLRGELTHIPLRVAADADARRIFWYAGKEFLGSGPPEDTLFWDSPIVGPYTVRAIDDRGRSCERMIQVRAAN